MERLEIVTWEGVSEEKILLRWRIRESGMGQTRVGGGSLFW